MHLPEFRPVWSKFEKRGFGLEDPERVGGDHVVPILATQGVTRLHQAVKPSRCRCTIMLAAV